MKMGRFYIPNLIPRSHHIDFHMKLSIKNTRSRPSLEAGWTAPIIVRNGSTSYFLDFFAAFFAGFFFAAFFASASLRAAWAAAKRATGTR